MKTFKQYLSETENKTREIPKLLELFEHEVYKRIEGPNGSYREDPANTNTLTQKHAHVFAKPNGKGGQLYSVNFDGSGHDGSSRTTLSTSHADFFRAKGYDIPTNNILESLDVASLDANGYELILLVDE